MTCRHCHRCTPADLDVCDICYDSMIDGYTYSGSYEPGGSYDSFEPSYDSYEED
jgi:hypothetical protein